MMLGFSYYGGKVRIAEWVIEHFPEHETYIEPFGGGAAVLLNKPRAKREFYNDIDKRIVNFFTVMRDEKMGDALIRRAQWTEMSDQVMREAREIMKRDLEIPSIDHAWAVLCSMVMSVGVDKYGVMDGKRAVLSIEIEQILRDIRDRFSKIRIWNRDALEVLGYEWVDRKDTLIYLDPPYVGEQQELYDTHMDVERFYELLDRLSRLKRARWIMSGWENEYYLDAVERYGLYIDRKEIKQAMGGQVTKVGVERGTRVEVLIMNYDGVKGTLDLF